MGYQVIARKWRPAQFDDVIGQHGLTKTLQNAILLNRVSHAYLFTGTRGVGKTTTARILAKALNCAQGPTPRPCDECESCKEIARGASVDVIEIDAASNRGIGEIRELRESVRYAPSRDRYKVFIIDEVHMLTTEAFNALLKTLEEPPPHVVFILATTELYKIPQTIVSRCQQFDFRIIPYADIRGRLMRVLQAENLEISETALQSVVKASGGSMRDAESALQKIISFGGGDLSDDDVAALLGVVKQEFINVMMQAVADSDYPSVIRTINDLFDKGHDLQNFIRACMEYLRNMLVYRISGDESQLLLLGDVDRSLLRELSGRFREEDMMRMYDLLMKADNELKWTPYIRFHTEMSFLKLAALPRLVPVEEALAILRSGAVPVAEPERELAPAPRPQPLPRPQPEPAAQGPASAAVRPAERVSSVAGRSDAFLEELARRHPQFRPILNRVAWKLSETRIEIQSPPGGIPERFFLEESHRKAMQDVFRSLFGVVPEVSTRTQEAAPAPPPAVAWPAAKAAPEAAAPAAEKKPDLDRLEKTFQDDPAGKVILDRIPGRWEFQPKE